MFRLEKRGRMSRFWSPIVDKLRPYTPGEQPRGAGLIKLNTNENPYGPSPLALEAIRAATGDGLRLYPDPEATDLRAAIAASLGLDADHVHAGNGSDEIVAQAFQAFFCGRGAVVFPDITYSFYRTYCALYAIEAETIPLDAAFRCDRDPRENVRTRTGKDRAAGPAALERFRCSRHVHWHNIAICEYCYVFWFS
jgi:histidinol-phosphate aminotransferase